MSKNTSLTKQPSKKEISVAVVTVSDSAFLQKRDDKSGPLLQQLLKDTTSFTVRLCDRTVIPDEIEHITSALRDLVSTRQPDVILTTGGTGFAPRDVTPEATKVLLEKECPGIVCALLMRSLQATPMAALTRLAAGIYGRTLIVNLPGSPKAVKECYEVLQPLLPHAVGLIRDEMTEVAATHETMQK